MANSYILALGLVLVQLVLLSHAASDNQTFTIMNFVPKDDFVLMECDCLDVNGNVTFLSDVINNCVDKWFPASYCPNGAQAKTFFCNFRYFVRDRTALTITPKYTNIMVWTSGGPANTYYQLTQDNVYGSTTYDSFKTTPTAQLNVVSAWASLYSGRVAANVLKAASVGNGQSF